MTCPCGAPVNADGQPVVYADEMLWTIYNGLFDHGIYNPYWNPAPSIPVEIIQKIYGYYNHYKNNILSSTIFGFWSDLDFGNASPNFPAINVNRQLTYCWTDDRNRNSLPVSVGYVFLNGPLVGEPNSNVILDGRIIPGYKNLIYPRSIQLMVSRD